MYLSPSLSIYIYIYIYYMYCCLTPGKQGESLIFCLSHRELDLAQ